MRGGKHHKPSTLPHPQLIALAHQVQGWRLEYLWSVRELAERSGLSERFIAQLERAEANPSVLTLVALADALDRQPHELLLHGDHTEAELRTTSAKNGATRTPTRRIALLGLRGAGKSTIGAAAAAALGVPFVELDAEIETLSGMRTGEIFEMHGVEAFRRFEREALDAALSDDRSAIIATSGGIVTDSAAFERLLAQTTTIWLKARPEDHFRRVMEQGDTRPSANRERAMDELTALLRARRALYERADEVVDTSRLGVERSVQRIVKIARRPRGE